LCITKENSNEFFEISEEKNEKEKIFNNFFINFSKNFSILKEKIYSNKRNNQQNIESSSLININFRELTSFLNYIDKKKI